MTFVTETGPRGCGPRCRGSASETSRCRHATRNSSWVHESPRARSASRATASRIVGAFRARVRKPISAVRSRWLEDTAVLLAVVLVVMTPARLRRGRSPTRRRSQPGTAARPSPVRRVHAPVAAHRFGCGADVGRLAMLGIGDRLMPRPHPFVVSDGLAVTADCSPDPDRRRLRSPPDHPGAPSSHWSPAGCSDRAPTGLSCATPDLRRHRRQRQHRLAVRADPYLSVHIPTPRRRRALTICSHVTELIVEIPRTGERARPAENDRSKKSCARSTTPSAPKFTRF